MSQATDTPLERLPGGGGDQQVPSERGLSEGMLRFRIAPPDAEQARRKEDRLAQKRQSNQRSRDFAARKLKGLEDENDYLRKQNKELKKRLGIEEGRWSVKVQRDSATGLVQCLPNRFQLENFPLLLECLTPAGHETGAVLLKNAATAWPRDLVTDPALDPEVTSTPVELELFTQTIRRAPRISNSPKFEHSFLEVESVPTNVDPTNAFGLFSEIPFMEEYLAEDVPDGEDIENVLEKNGGTYKTTYISDITDEEIGTLARLDAFPVSISKAELRKLPGNLLTLEPKGGGDVPGISTDYGYYGFRGSVFALHVEDWNLHSVSFLLWGGPKTWIVVRPSDAERLENAIKKDLAGYKNRENRLKFCFTPPSALSSKA